MKAQNELSLNEERMRLLKEQNEVLKRELKMLEEKKAEKIKLGLVA